MANQLAQVPEITESLSSPLATPLETLHPGQHPSITNVPVTPDIHQGETNYGNEPNRRPGFSYFGEENAGTAQSPQEAAKGAKSNRDILRRMSLSRSYTKQESLNDVDPRVANPSLGLSGGVISATFCIPHSLQFRKGVDWVSRLLLHSHGSILTKSRN